MIINKRNNLIVIISRDLFYHSKLQLLLLAVIIISAVLVITITHHTRQLATKFEQMILEKDALDTEWRNLILAENALGNHVRIERIAIEELQMQHVNSSQENIVVYP